MVAKILLLINSTDIFDDMITILIKEVSSSDNKNKYTAIQEVFINLGNEL
jgi:hypothetical protein